jgi:hypothetical protein
MARKPLRTLVLAAGIAALAVGALAADAADQNSRVAGKAYSWSVTPAGGGAQCREEWSFGQDGVMTVLSGEERVTKRFTLRTIPGQPMFELEATRLSTNGKADCQGTRNSKTGQTSLTYLMFLNGGGFVTCASTDTMSCYGVATPSATPTP